MNYRDEHIRPPRPFPRSYWVEPGLFMAGYYPGDVDAAEEAGKLQKLLDCDVSVIINLVETDEITLSDDIVVDYSASLMEMAREMRRDIRIHRFPVQDMSVPDTGTMGEILDTIDAEIGKGRLVYVHCLGGLGRTGTVVGCWLVRHGVASGDSALAQLAVLRQEDEYSHAASPQTWEQCEYVKRWTAGR
jgi:protein-tyrosine phosphatase